MEGFCNADWYQVIAPGQRKHNWEHLLGGRAAAHWPWEWNRRKAAGSFADFGTHPWYRGVVDTWYHLQLATARAADWTHCQKVPRLNPAQFCWTGGHQETLGGTSALCHPERVLDPLQTSCLMDHWYTATSGVASGHWPTVPNKHI